MVGVVTAAEALVLLDFQVGLCDPGDHCRAPELAAQVADKSLIAKVRAVLDRVRSMEIPVIHVRLAFDPTYELRTNRSARFDAYRDAQAMLDGSPEAAIVADLQPVGGEPVVRKGAVDPFVGTPLAAMLLGRGIRRVALAGVATNLVVESAARHACDLGLQVTVLEDLCASFRADLHDFAVRDVLPMFAHVTTAETWLSTSHRGVAS